MSALSAAGLAAAGFGTAGEFFDCRTVEETECVVAEFALSDLGGLALLTRFSGSGTFVPVVFVSSRATIGEAVAAMKAGASDFLEKPVQAADLLAAVRHAISRSELYRLFELESRTRRRLAELSLREREVLDLVVRGMSTKQIAYELGRVEKTVEFHRRNLMRKLGATNVAELVRKVAFATLRHQASVNGGAQAYSNGDGQTAGC